MSVYWHLSPARSAIRWSPSSVMLLHKDFLTSFLIGLLSSIAIIKLIKIELSVGGLSHKWLHPSLTASGDTTLILIWSVSGSNYVQENILSVIWHHKFNRSSKINQINIGKHQPKGKPSKYSISVTYTQIYSILLVLKSNALNQCAVDQMLAFLILHKVCLKNTWKIKPSFSKILQLLKLLVIGVQKDFVIYLFKHLISSYKKYQK